METTDGQPTDDRTEPGRQTAADRRTTEERPEKEGRRADNARRPFLAMKEAARSSRSRASGRSTGNPRQQRRPTARQPDGQTATSRGHPVYKPREATTSSRAAATAPCTEPGPTPPDAHRARHSAAQTPPRPRAAPQGTVTGLSGLRCWRAQKTRRLQKVFPGRFASPGGLRRSFS